MSENTSEKNWWKKRQEQKRERRRKKMSKQKETKITQLGLPFAPGEIPVKLPELVLPPPQFKAEDIRIDFDRLALRCRQSIIDLMGEIRTQGGELYRVEEESSNPAIKPVTTPSHFALHDRGDAVKILAVAHLDTVQSGSFLSIPVSLEKETLCFCPKLDDRLGVYTILDLLPQYGVSVDILLTEDEESMRSTAQCFIPENDKKYHWIVEFDRKGEDAVTYQFDWEKKLEPFFEIGVGSTSDISYLDDLGCLALNVGIGYHEEHNARAFFAIEEYKRQIARFLYFYQIYKDTHFPFKKKIGYYQGGYGDYGLGLGVSANHWWGEDYKSKEAKSNWNWKGNGHKGITTPLVPLTPILPVKKTITEDMLSHGDCSGEDEMVYYCSRCNFYFDSQDTILTLHGAYCPECGIMVDELDLTLLGDR